MQKTWDSLLNVREIYMGSAKSFSVTENSYSLFVERVNTSDWSVNTAKKEFSHFSITGTKLKDDQVEKEIFPKVISC